MRERIQEGSECASKRTSSHSRFNGYGYFIQFLDELNKVIYELYKYIKKESYTLYNPEKRYLEKIKCVEI